MKTRLGFFALALALGTLVGFLGFFSGHFSPLVGTSLAVGIVTGMMVDRDNGDLAGRVIAAFVVSLFVAFFASVPGYDPPQIGWYRFYSVLFFLFSPFAAYNSVMWIRRGRR